MATNSTWSCPVRQRQTGNKGKTSYIKDYKFNKVFWEIKQCSWNLLFFQHYMAVNSVSNNFIIHVTISLKVSKHYKLMLHQSNQMYKGCTKTVQRILTLVATYNVSKKRRWLWSIDAFLQVWNKWSLKEIVMVFKFCKKYPINKQALKNKLFFKNFRKFSELSVLESLCYKILDQ